DDYKRDRQIMTAITHKRYGLLKSAMALLSIFCSLAFSTAYGRESPTVGIEGVYEATLPSRMIYARPAHERDDLLVQVRTVVPATSDTWRYRFSYIGMVPGEYDLRNYLWLPDDMTTSSLAAMPVKILPILPPDFRGELTATQMRGVNIPGGYRMALLLVVILWVVLLPILLVLTREPQEEVEIEEAPPPPSLADRLRPLVEKAAQGDISRDEKAVLERLLIGYWRRKLHLEGDMGECIQQLKADAEAGALVRALEAWLHRPAGAEKVDVAVLLEPYRNVAVDFEMEQRLTEDFEVQHG
ncbi:MAG: hypothetical protein ACOCVL_01610, partial [Candidatus Sumerlaeota bacterium]